MTDVRNIEVDLGDRSYDIVVGPGLLSRAAQYLKPVLASKRIAIVTDETVAGLHLETLMGALDGHGFDIETIILPPGEGQKSFDVLQTVLSRLFAKSFGRNDTLIAFGGGVIGDLTGFAASIMKRGCQFVQIPTTLLAQVDSSVGGKTAINTPAGKNLVGCFYQPKLVLTDTDVLSTLPLRQLKAGYAEVVKYGLINNADFFGWLEGNAEKILAGDAEALSYAIEVSCASKAAIVKEDEREHGARALLNLGHSFGHALEAKGGYSDILLHGEAVSAGLLMAHEFSHNQDLCPAQDVERVRAHFVKLGLPTMVSLPPELKENSEALFNYMMQDKKNKNNNLTLILTKGIGKSYVAETASKACVKSYLETACQPEKA